MSRPIMTFALSEDGHSIYVYRGSSENGELEACLSTHREDLQFQLGEYTESLVRDALESREPDLGGDDMDDAPRELINPDDFVVASVEHVNTEIGSHSPADCGPGCAFYHG